MVITHYQMRAKTLSNYYEKGDKFIDRGKIVCQILLLIY